MLHNVTQSSMLLHHTMLLHHHTMLHNVTQSSHNVTQCYSIITQCYTMLLNHHTMLLNHHTMLLNHHTMLHNVTQSSHNATHLLNNPFHIRFIEESQRCQVYSELGCAPHVHGVDSIWTDWVVADCKDAVITSKVKESGEAQIDCVNNTVNYWVAFHCGDEEWAGRDG